MSVFAISSSMSPPENQFLSRPSKVEFVFVFAHCASSTPLVFISVLSSYEH